MAAEAKLSHTAAMILQAIHSGYVYGFSIMEMTGLPSGTVYPAAAFVRLADKAGAWKVEINLEQSQNSTQFDEVRHGPAGIEVPNYVRQLLEAAG